MQLALLMSRYKRSMLYSLSTFTELLTTKLRGGSATRMAFPP